MLLTIIGIVFVVFASAFFYRAIYVVNNFFALVNTLMALTFIAIGASCIITGGS